MAKKYSIQINGADNRPLYLHQIAMRKGTIYPTHLSFTADKKAAARFELHSVFMDAADAIDALFVDRRATCVEAHRNPSPSAILYISFE